MTVDCVNRGIPYVSSLNFTHDKLTRLKPPKFNFLKGVNSFCVVVILVHRSDIDILMSHIDYQRLPR